jgi:hypothetical protein
MIQLGCFLLSIGIILGGVWADYSWGRFWGWDPKETWSSEGSSTTATLDNFNVWTPIYTYDANGNMTSDGHLCYEFNDSNQLYRVKNCGTGHTIAVYVYDYNGNRMIKNNYVNNTLNNTVISWSDSFETKTVTGESTQSTTYYFINSELVAKKNPDSSRYYFHTDHLGSSTSITDSACSS